MHHPFKRHLSLIVLLTALLPSAGAAQTVAASQPQLPMCIPLVNGYPAGVPRWEWGQVGEHLFWPCRAKLGAPVVWFGVSCLHGSCSHRKLGDAITEITRASAKVATAKRLWEQNIQFDYSVALEQTPRGALAREWADTLKRRKPIWSAS